MECPHCHISSSKNNTKIEKARIYVQNYGESHFVLVCPHCKKKYGFYVELTTKVNKATKVEDDAEVSYER
jgi:phage FluMu protein Com